MNQLSHVCRICLVSGDTLQLHSIESTQLQDTFEMLSQTQLMGGDLPKSVCYICRSQLRKCQRLMQFVQESDSMLKLMLLYETTADTVAKRVGSRSPLKLQKTEPVFLSIPNLVNLPAPEIKTETLEPENIVEVSGSQKGTEVTIEKEKESIEEEHVVIKEDRDLRHQSSVKEEKVLMYEDVDLGNEKLKIKDEKEQVILKDDLRDENPRVKEEVETNMENIEETTLHVEDSTENEVNVCDKDQIIMIKKRIAMLKEEIAKEKEQKAKVKEKKAIEKEEVSVKQELIAQGDVLEEELRGASVKEEIDEEDARIAEYCSKISTEPAISNEGLVNVSSSKLLNELQKVLRQNSGILPEIKEMEVDSAQTSRDRMHKCIICDRGYVSEDSCEHHMRKHKEDTPYGCRLCRRAFAKQAHLDSHMRIHISEKKHECKICERAFRPAAALAAHMRMHTSERHLCCRRCKKRYKTVLALRDHYKTHKVKRDPVLPK